MTNTMIFNFDDLPLVMAGTVEAALINGQAVIEYDNSGNWGIVDISLEDLASVMPMANASGRKSRHQNRSPA